MLSHMTLPVQFHSYTFREYLQLEEFANVKHEYFNGEIYAMTGGTPAHAGLSAAVIAAFSTQLQGGSCRVFTSNLRVRVLATGLAAYPDVTVVCGEAQFDPESDSTVINPRVLVEVLSPSTTRYDRGEKLAQYKQIDSLQVVLLFSQNSPRVELHERAEGGFRTEVIVDDQLLKVSCIGFELALSSIYKIAGL